MAKDQLAKYELHDALIHRAVVDHEKGTVTIDISYYPHSDTPKRRKAMLIFEGVEAVSHVVSITGLKSNAWAGNIGCWEPCSKRGTTFIHLTSGTIAVTAKKASFKVKS
jgi:hypothetical protein